MGEIYFESEMSRTKLVCNFQVIVYHLAEPVNPVSEWEKFQLQIKAPRGENPCNGVGFVFASELGHIPSRTA